MDGSAHAYRDLEEKVVVITGAGSGIGRSTAKLFGYHRSKVVAIGRRRALLEETVAELRDIGAEAIAVPADVSREDNVMKALATALGTFGRIDVLVNNAFYGGKRGHIVDSDGNDWNRVLATNVVGAMYCAKHAAKDMISRRNGAIINVSSLAAKVPRLGLAPYCASKAALDQLTRVLALELGRYGVRANAVSPGSTRTAGLERSMGSGGGAPTLDDRVGGSLELMRSPIVLGRLAEPEDQGAAIMFLASDTSSFITGQVLYVDGGAGLI